MKIKEIKRLLKGLEIIGDIAIISIKEEHKRKGKKIAEELLSNHKQIKTVLIKTQPISGTYRTMKLEWLAGEKRTITTYKENGCIFKVDLEKTFFTPRLSNERLRIAKEVKEGETIINMFAGVGTYSIIIAKKAKPKRVYSIDINPAAIELTKKNIKLNKVNETVIPILGDSKEIIIKKLSGTANRVLMPLPQLAERYLRYAIIALKEERGIIHVYDFIRTPKNIDPKIMITQRYRERLKELGKEFTIKRVKKVGEVAPRKYRMVLDIEIR